MHQTQDNKNFYQITLKRSDCINTFIDLQKDVLIENHSIKIDPTILFSRLLALIDRTDSIAEYFDYELTPGPTSLFRDNLMRKSNQSVLAKILTIGTQSQGYQSDTKKVLDGGAFLHHVKWVRGTTYSKIFDQYSNFLRSKYGTCTVVFDGYGNGPSTKDHEHVRRRKTPSSFVRLTPESAALTEQNILLSNERNKIQFIDLLSNHLISQGFTIHQSLNGADTLIVKQALEGHMRDMRDRGI